MKVTAKYKYMNGQGENKSKVEVVDGQGGYIIEKKKKIESYRVWLLNGGKLITIVQAR